MSRWHSAIYCNLCYDSFMETTAYWIIRKSLETISKHRWKARMRKNLIYMLLYPPGKNKRNKTKQKKQISAIWAYVLYLLRRDTMCSNIPLLRHTGLKCTDQILRPKFHREIWISNILFIHSPQKIGADISKCSSPQKDKGAMSHSKCNVSVVWSWASRWAAHLSIEIDFCNRSNVTFSTASYRHSPPPQQQSLKTVRTWSWPHKVTGNRHDHLFFRKNKKSNKKILRKFSLSLKCETKQRHLVLEGVWGGHHWDRHSMVSQ